MDGVPFEEIFNGEIKGVLVGSILGKLGSGDDSSGSADAAIAPVNSEVPCDIPNTAAMAMNIEIPLGMLNTGRKFCSILLHLYVTSVRNMLCVSLYNFVTASYYYAHYCNFDFFLSFISLSTYLFQNFISVAPSRKYLKFT